MRVAVLGGGLQGCCTALALAERGVDVVLVDQNQSLLSRTATANEGKIHLGYMYAADPTLATARTMMEGALAFAPFLQRYTGDAMETFKTSRAAHYVVHRDSQRSVAAVGSYLNDVHQLIARTSAGREFSYFGLDISRPPRPWRASERDGLFNPDTAVAVFETPEVAIDPLDIADRLSRSIDNHPRIEVRLGHQVLRVQREQSRIHVSCHHRDGTTTDGFDHVVNALWGGRLAIDSTLGLKPPRPWLHRLKYGISFTLPNDYQSPLSITVVSGPFGEVVSYRDRRMYLTWYPECMQGISAEIIPPDWPTYPSEPLRSRTIQRSLTAMSNILPGLRMLDPAHLADAAVKGGLIMAWGNTDIDDPTSHLHQRHQIGIASFGHYHSIDPGKLTMAPYFAERCAERICGIRRN
jgi:glycine/D-amino acid oxidase-like deaminating enzyme